MIPQEIIRHKRDGHKLADSEIAAFIAGLTRGDVSPMQAAAFAMAVYFQSMDAQECVALTRAMTASGARMNWDLPGPVLDKHSTGGIGDSVSLVLAPLIAACGGYVPMISGRGLGHTGGTLDKLDSIPGYVSTPTRAHFQKVVRDVGCAIIGQTDDLAPADRVLYAIRDVTATVESIPLITASILSKKLAAGLNGLVMDVKVGNGAFMTEPEQARALAQSLASVARGADLPTIALITAMDQPLATCAGNALEVRHVLRHLTGAAIDTRLHDCTIALGVEMLLLGKLAADASAARAMLERAFTSGAAADYFARMVAALGGPTNLLTQYDTLLPQAPLRHIVKAERPGYVSAINTRALGLAVLALGGGRRNVAEKIDYAVGLSHLARLGVPLDKGDGLALIHSRDEESALEAARIVMQAYTIGTEPKTGSPLIIETITG